MASERFLMDHGAGHRTLLWRQPAAVGRTMHVWRDARLGAKWEIEFEENDDGYPIDCFGLPLFGEFIEPSIKDY